MNEAKEYCITLRHLFGLKYKIKVRATELNPYWSPYVMGFNSITIEDTSTGEIIYDYYIAPSHFGAWCMNPTAKVETFLREVIGFDNLIMYEVEGL